LQPAFLSQLQRLLGDTRLLTDAADCRTYGYDNSMLQGQPLAVALPESHEEVVSLIRACREHRVALIARGQGTGTTGATVPLDANTLIVSLQRMNRIREISPDDRLMVVEPGVTNEAVQTAAAEHGFFWPPDPTSAAICTVGGNLAYNSAGPRAVKYGTPRENTLALKAVTGAGETIHTGVRTTKGVVGYDLTRLLIGSEGTLAVITEATLKLTPLQPAKRTLRAFYRDVHSAAHAVAAIMAQPVVPCALEFMDGNAIEMVRPEVGDSLPEGAGALLMIEVDGIASQLDELVECVVRAAGVDGALGVEAARSSEEVAALWSIRKALSPALRRVAPKKINEDVVVPVSRIPDPPPDSDRQLRSCRQWQPARQPHVRPVRRQPAGARDGLPGRCVRRRAAHAGHHFGRARYRSGQARMGRPGTGHHQPATDARHQGPVRPRRHPEPRQGISRRYGDSRPRHPKPRMTGAPG
jgi:D-lactate dehydrogenase